MLLLSSVRRTWFILSALLLAGVVLALSVGGVAAQANTAPEFPDSS